MAHSITRFCDIITRSAFQEGKLKLNKKFTHEHGKEFSHVARLSIPTGRCWDVRVQRDANGGIWLQDGFSRFMEDNGVGIFYFLMFKHEGSSKLLVHIYDLTATEILYNCSSGVSQSCNAVNEIQIDETEDDDDEIQIDETEDDDNEIQIDETEDDDDEDSSFKYDDDDEDSSFKYVSDDSSVEYLGSTIDCLLPKVVPEPSKLELKYKEDEGTSSGTTGAQRCYLTSKKKQKMEGGSDTNHLSPQVFPEPTSFASKDKLNKGVSRKATRAGQGCPTRMTGQATPRDGRSNASPAGMKRRVEPNSFQVPIRPYHLNKGIARLPSAFAKAHMACSTRFIKLVDAYNQEWDVLYDHTPPSSYMLKKGWHGFVNDNDLTGGDTCVFERIGSGGDVKLKVKIKHATPPAEKMLATIPNSFRILIKPYHLTASTLKLPNDFVEAHMCCSTQFIKLVDAYNKEWEVLYKRNHTGYILKTRWHVFVKEKGLKEGDICVFERVGSDEDVRLKVNIIKGDKMRTLNPSSSRSPVETSSCESL